MLRPRPAIPQFGVPKMARHRRVGARRMEIGLPRPVGGHRLPSNESGRGEGQSIGGERRHGARGVAEAQPRPPLPAWDRMRRGHRILQFREDLRPTAISAAISAAEIVPALRRRPRGMDRRARQSVDGARASLVREKDAAAPRGYDTKSGGGLRYEVSCEAAPGCSAGRACGRVGSPSASPLSARRY